jgi:hypothetical protein
MGARVGHDDFILPFRIGQIFISLGNIGWFDKFLVVDQPHILDAEGLDCVVLLGPVGITGSGRRCVRRQDTLGFES